MVTSPLRPRFQGFCCGCSAASSQRYCARDEHQTIQICTAVPRVMACGDLCSVALGRPELTVAALLAVPAVRRALWFAGGPAPRLREGWGGWPVVGAVVCSQLCSRRRSSRCRRRRASRARRASGSQTYGPTSVLAARPAATERSLATPATRSALDARRAATARAPTRGAAGR